MNQTISKICIKCTMVLTYDAYNETIEKEQKLESDLNDLKKKLVTFMELPEERFYIRVIFWILVSYVMWINHLNLWLKELVAEKTKNWLQSNSKDTEISVPNHQFRMTEN